jgi:uncharacterized protein (DUF927 family)
MSRKPKETVRNAIDAAKPAEASETEDASRKTGAEARLRKFKMLETGLHCLVDDQLKWICAPFSVEAETRDEAGGWGLQLAWRNRDGELQTEIFDRAALAGDCRDVRVRLAAGGLTQAGDNLSRGKLVEFLNLIDSRNRARCVSSTGWHVVNGKRVFVLPDEVIGGDAKSVILQSAGRDRAPFNKGGTLRGWRETIGRFCIMNSRLIFSVSVAFAGPLVDLAGEDGGGWNLKGGSRIGKSTALRLAASVWGGDTLSGAAGFLRSWRSTSNGLESVATQFSDTLLCLDEMGQCEAREIGDIAYMLANGSGKARAGRDGGARAPARWRVLFLSSGEVGLADKNLEARLNTKAGQQVRLIDVIADADKGYGLYEELHGDVSADRFAEALRTACRQNYGWAGPEFLNWLVGRLAADPEFSSGVAQRVDELVRAWLKDWPDASGQVRSVARRYALVAVAGELASEAGITGWERLAAVSAVRAMFASWLADRGSTGAAEDMQAKRQLAAFIARHGSGRFELWQKSTLRQNEDGELVEDEPSIIERNKTLVRAGWRRVIEQDGRQIFEYYMTDEAMQEALAGLNFKPAVKSLCEAGFVIPDPSGKSPKVGRTPPGVGKTIRLYLVPGHVIGAEDSED